MKKITIFLLVIIFLFSVLRFLSSARKIPKIRVGNTTLSIEVADTPEKRNQGLSDRKSLYPDCGLLFIFDSPGIYPFWMRRMYFDIDILWIRNGEVADITYGAKAPPKFSLTPRGCQAGNGECLNPEWETPKTFYQSKIPVNMVLEVNAGWVKEKGIKIRDRVDKLR